MSLCDTVCDTVRLGQLITHVQNLESARHPTGSLAAATEQRCAKKGVAANMVCSLDDGRPSVAQPPECSVHVDFSCCSISPAVSKPALCNRQRQSTPLETKAKASPSVPPQPKRPVSQWHLPALHMCTRPSHAQPHPHCRASARRAPSCPPRLPARPRRPRGRRQPDLLRSAVLHLGRAGIFRTNLHPGP